MSLNKLMHVDIGREVRLNIGAEIISCDNILVSQKDISRPSHGVVYNDSSYGVAMPTGGQWEIVSKGGALLFSGSSGVQEKVNGGSIQGLQLANPGVWRLTSTITFTSDVATEFVMRYRTGTESGNPKSKHSVPGAIAMEFNTATFSELVKIPSAGGYAESWFILEAQHVNGAPVNATISSWSMCLEWVSELPPPI